MNQCLRVWWLLHKMSDIARTKQYLSSDEFQQSFLYMPYQLCVAMQESGGMPRGATV